MIQEFACSACGGSFPPGARFCPACGLPVATMALPLPRPAAAAP